MAGLAAASSELEETVLPQRLEKKRRPLELHCHSVPSVLVVGCPLVLPLCCRLLGRQRWYLMLLLPEVLLEVPWPLYILHLDPSFP